MKMIIHACQLEQKKGTRTYNDNKSIIVNDESSTQSDKAEIGYPNSLCHGVRTTRGTTTDWQVQYEGKKQINNKTPHSIQWKILLW